MFEDPFKPQRGRKNSNPFGGSLDFGLGLKKTTERDTRRSFTKTQKNQIWAQQNGKCAKCKKSLDPRTVEYDHKKGWADKGQTVVVNGQALCANCHKIKTHNSRLKKIEKKPSKPKSPFGESIFGSSTKNKKSKNPFDF